MKNVSSAIAMLTVLFFSCKERPKQESNGIPQEAHNSQNSLDWAGTYQGTLPCADCAGIKTTIELRLDFTYSKKEEYIVEENEKPAVHVETGKFEWDKSGLNVILTSDSTNKRQYKVGENKITHLDNECKEITGSLSELYILKKQ